MRGSAGSEGTGRRWIMDIIYFLGAVALWFVLIKWVLPRFGVAT